MKNTSLFRKKQERGIRLELRRNGLPRCRIKRKEKGSRQGALDHCLVVLSLGLLKAFLLLSCS